MGEQVSMQPIIGLVFIYAGLLIGVVFHILQVLHLIVHHRILAGISDLLFAILAGSIYMYASVLSNGGCIRIYPLILLVIGFLLEQSCVNPLFLRFIHRKEG